MSHYNTTASSKMSMLFTLAAACDTDLTPARLNKAKMLPFRHILKAYNIYNERRTANVACFLLSLLSI